MHWGVNITKRNSTIALMKIAEAAINSTDYAIVYRMTKELVGDRKLFDDSEKNVKSGSLNHDDEQLKRRKKHFTTFLNRGISGKAAHLLDDIASFRNMRIRTTPPSRSQLTLPLTR